MFWVKTTYIFCQFSAVLRIRMASGAFLTLDPKSRMENAGSGIRNKHPRSATFPYNKVTNFILEKPAQVWFPESVPTALYGRQPGFYSQVLEFGPL
jgi:hypothetical protein